MLIGDEENTLRGMRKVIEENFSYEVLVAKNKEEILSIEDVNLIITCADMKFIEGVKVLATVENDERFNEIPFAITMPEKISELINKINQTEERNSVVEEVAESVVVHSDRKKLGRVVTNFIGYESDCKI